MFSLSCKTIQHSDQRYSTLGDYFTEGGCTQYRISSLSNNNYEFLIFLHEVCEKQLCKKLGITEQMVDAWDLNHEDAEEPGALPDCPYREAHLIAEGMERAMATKLGVDWSHYEKTCRAIMENALPPADPTIYNTEGSYVPRKMRGYTNAGNRTKIAVPKKVKRRSILGEK